MFQAKRKAVNGAVGLFLAAAMLAASPGEMQASQYLTEASEAAQASQYLTGIPETIQASQLPEDSEIGQHALGASVKKSKGMEYQTWKTQKGAVCVVKNTKSYALNLVATCTFYNKSKKKVGDRSTANYCLEAGKQCVFSFLTPRNSKGKTVTFNSHKISFRASRARSSIEYGTKYIKTIKKSKTATGVSAKFKNNSKKKWQFIHATCIFYDSKGRAIGESSQYLHCEKPKSSVSAVFSQPRDTKSYQPLKWKSYKIFIDYAYKYRSAK